MRIALVGYGKMGKAIEKIALSRGHEIVFRINSLNATDIENLSPENTDVVIEFTRPELAPGHLTTLIRNRLPVVCGTTAWQHAENRIYQLVKEENGSLVHASNFSPGVNIFFVLNEYLAKMMVNWPAYKASITEIHHTAKLDAPSGTAITLANGILEQRNDLTQWAEGNDAKEGTLPIYSIRQDPAPGTHTISYKSDIDDITISHEAHTREGFATGAIMAAEWITGKQGVFTMRDVLSI